MSLPYENATSGQAAMMDIQKILLRFGCSSFGQMIDMERKEIIVQFRWRQYPITARASISGYAAAWLREHPWSIRLRRTGKEHEQKAMDIASVAVYSILRDWIKGQITAIETGILTVEGAFLGQIMLADGSTFLERAVGITWRQAGCMTMRRRVTDEMGSPEDTVEWVHESAKRRMGQKEKVV